MILFYEYRDDVLFFEAGIYGKARLRNFHVLELRDLRPQSMNVQLELRCYAQRVSLISFFFLHNTFLSRLGRLFHNTVTDTNSTLNLMDITFSLLSGYHQIPPIAYVS